MARRIAVSNLQASTIDILNTIRANASYQYQSQVPEVTTNADIPKVGDVLFGYPAFANEFLSALVNRIAIVRVKSATFNNAYAMFKKGYLEFGETVEEVFVNICKAREFSAEKAEARELKRSIPDVRSAFHTMNWKVQYPVTIQDEDLRMAFLSADGVTDLISRIVGMVSVAAEYDEYLLFKYLMIKAIAHGKMYPVAIGGTGTLNDSAKTFRSLSNKLTFMNTKYNEAGVHTVTNRDDQYIFMDSDFNAQFDVELLANAFNMDKATFIGHQFLIDSWTEFDNDRFTEITAGSDMIESITSDELSLMADVKAVILDKEWFQVFDNQNKFTEKYVASGEYWNYFYNVWKTVSSSPFSNAIVVVGNSATISAPDTFKIVVSELTQGENATTTSFVVKDSASLQSSNCKFIQTEDAVEDMVAVHPYGAYLFPALVTDVVVEIDVNGVAYVSATAATAEGVTTYTEAAFESDNASIGDEVLMVKKTLITE